MVLRNTALFIADILVLQENYSLKIDLEMSIM